MDADLKENPKLLQEYDEVFDNEEKIVNSLKINHDSFSIRPEVVAFKDISVSSPVKKSRKDTYLGLTKMTEELGILEPIHVMITEGYSDWIESGADEEYPGTKYMILDGFRRVYAGLKVGLTKCNAIVWDFKDKELGSKLLLPLRLILNKSARNSWSEVWGLMQILEVEMSISPGTMDSLLQLEAGDSTKLKAIMQCEYPEVKDELMSNKKSISQCYNMLQKLLKEEDQLMNEDRQGISSVEEGSKILDTGSTEKEDRRLSDQEVHDILEMDNNFSGELTEDDFNELAGNNVPEDRQTAGDRHPLDPKLRAAVLTRDGYCCQVSGNGKNLPIELAMAILHVHHLVPVYLGGTDTIENLITVDLTVHTLIHIIERNDGRIGMSKEEFDKLDPGRQEYMKKIMRIARYAVEARRRAGISKEKIKKESEKSSRFKMPGVEQKENLSALKEAE